MEPWWIPPLRDVVGGRDVVIAGAVPAAWVDHAEQLRAAGARDVMVAGRQVVARGRLATVDLKSIRLEAERAAAPLWERMAAIA